MMRRASSSTRKPLSNLEQTVMETVWRQPGCTADEVRVAMEGEHPLKESTVRTLLRRLEAKGYLTHAVEGRTFVYRAVSAPQQLAASAVRRIIDRFCNGSLEQLLVGLVENDIVDAPELQRLAARIDRHRAAQPQPQAPPQTQTPARSRETRRGEPASEKASRGEATATASSARRDDPGDRDRRKESK